MTTWRYTINFDSTNAIDFKLGMRAIRTAAVVLALSAATRVAQANIVLYPDAGTENSATYTFTASTTGDLIGFFAGSTAGYDEQVGLLDNGVLTSGGYGLDDHASNIGQSFDFGMVHAGDILIFVDQIITGNPGFVYSDSSLNGPYDGGHNHVYSADTVAGQISSLIPAGTYVAFEDEPASFSDFNYFDDTFVFQDVATATSAIPEPSTWAAAALMLVPLGLGAIRKLRGYRA
jgi:hypothetical protein